MTMLTAKQELTTHSVIVQPASANLEHGLCFKGSLLTASAPHNSIFNKLNETSNNEGCYIPLIAQPQVDNNYIYCRSILGIMPHLNDATDEMPNSFNFQAHIT